MYCVWGKWGQWSSCTTDPVCSPVSGDCSKGGDSTMTRVRHRQKADVSADYATCDGQGKDVKPCGKS